MPAARGEHLHIRPHRGKMGREDPVTGYTIVGYEYEDGRYQDTIIVVDGIRTILADFLDSLPPTMRAETIPFPWFNGCCELIYES